MRIGLFIVVAVLAAGCERGGEAADDVTAATRAKSATTDDAVSAALHSPGSSPVKLQFVIDSRPVPGTPFRLKLIATAATPLPDLQMVAESADLSLPATTAVLPLAQAGVAGTHEITVTPQREGLAEVRVLLRTAPAGPESVYVIPVLVSAPAAPAG